MSTIIDNSKYVLCVQFYIIINNLQSNIENYSTHKIKYKDK